MYSTIVNGKVLDWHFKSLGPTCLSAFYIGDVYVGQVGKMRKGNWSAACGNKPSAGLCPVNGFRSRLDAAEFLLKLGGYHK